MSCSDYGLDHGYYNRSPDYQKDPNSVEDYEINWAVELDQDSIVTSTFLLPDGLTEDDSDFTDQTATIFLSGGTEGVTYRVTNRITTTGGRTFDKTLYIYVVEQ